MRSSAAVSMPSPQTVAPVVLAKRASASTSAIFDASRSMPVMSDRSIFRISGPTRTTC